MITLRLENRWTGRVLRTLEFKDRAEYLRWQQQQSDIATLTVEWFEGWFADMRRRAEAQRQRMTLRRAAPHLDFKARAAGGD